MENRDEVRKWKMEDANKRENNENEKRDEMENLQAMLYYSVYTQWIWVAEIMQKFERKTIFIDDDALWIDDENAIWNIIVEF